MGATKEAAATRERPAARHRKDKLSMLTQSPIFGDPRLPARFWRKVRVRENGCWEWTGSLKDNGYGQFNNGRPRRAHRVAYEALIGPIPDGLECDHLCRNRDCTAPAHIELVTRKENVRRGCGMGGELRASSTHCRQGHLLNDNNLYVAPDGERVCRSCAKS